MNAIKPDAQAFDEIRIRVVPRFKDSELSGSEWRISAVTEFYRKGQLICSEQCSNMETAAGLCYAHYVRAVDNGNGYFAGDGIHCDQEGCNEKAAFKYSIKQDYCSGYGNCGQKKDMYNGALRHFCEKHSHRGDSDLQDNDKNYELIGVV